jgi:hypothetical protein
MPFHTTIPMACVGGDIVTQHKDTGGCLIKYLSLNGEVKDVGPVIQRFGDEFKLLTKAKGAVPAECGWVGHKEFGSCDI